MKVDIDVLLVKANFNTEYQEEHFKELVKDSLDDEGYLLPFWLKYPDIPIDSIGWRMGSGEDYMFVNQLYYQCLSDEDKNYYRKKYVKPLPKPQREENE